MLEKISSITMEKDLDSAFANIFGYRILEQIVDGD